MELNKPQIFYYSNSSEYIAALVKWLKTNKPKFSIRKATKKIVGCSPSLITQITKGARKLTLDRIDPISEILELDPQEKRQLIQFVTYERKKRYLKDKFEDISYLIAQNQSNDDQDNNLIPSQNILSKKEPKNHLLNNWFNVYIKDLCRIKGFEPKPEIIYQMLKGLISHKQIEKALSFLLREGFLLKTLDNKIVENESLTVTTDNIPNKKIQTFHKKALDIAKKAMDLYSCKERRANAIVFPLNESNYEKLERIIKSFVEKIAEFAEEHKNDSDVLYQVIINVCPVGYAQKKEEM